MNDLKERIKTKVEVFLKNGFKYAGELLSVDDTFISIHDDKTNKDMFFAISEIMKIEVQE